jgi:membrane fusion protein, multidrug efflux system
VTDMVSPGLWLIAALAIADVLGPPAGARAQDRSTPTPVAPSALVEVSAVRLVPMRETVVGYGSVEFSPEQSQVLDLEAERLVTRVWVAAGQSVRRGDRLISVRATPAAQLELDQARIEVEFAGKAVDRLRDLRRRQLATNAEVLAAEAQLAKADATLTSVRKRLGGPADVTLPARVDGIVEAVNVREGDIVAPHTPLLRLAGGDHLRVRLGVEPEDISRVRRGQTVEVAPVHGGRSVRARTAQVYRQVDPKTRLAEVVVPLPAGSGLLPGAMARGDIILRARPAVLAVPRAAVLTEAERSYVFVVAKGRAWRRWITVGAGAGHYTEVVRGLSPADLVVTIGNYEITDGMVVRVDERAR